MADHDHSGTALKTPLRLDLQPAFTRLSYDLSDLARFASIAESLGEEAMTPADAIIVKAAIGSPDYVPVLMTVAQWDNLSFIISHVAEAANRASRQYDAAVESSLEAGR